MYGYFDFATGDFISTPNAQTEAAYTLYNVAAQLQVTRADRLLSSEVTVCPQTSDEGDATKGSDISDW